MMEPPAFSPIVTDYQGLDDALMKGAVPALYRL